MHLHFQVPVALHWHAAKYNSEDAGCCPRQDDGGYKFGVQRKALTREERAVEQENGELGEGDSKDVEDLGREEELCSISHAILQPVSLALRNISRSCVLTVCTCRPNP